MRSAIVLYAAGLLGFVPVVAGELGTYTVHVQAEAGTYAATGTIQAVRAGTLASQISGRVTDCLLYTSDAADE